jgi:hypothetical protein
LQDKLAKIVLIKRPMRFGGLVKRKAPSDMDLERPGPRQPRRFDKAIEFLNCLRVGHSVVGLGINSKRRLGRGFDTVGIRDAPSRAHRGESLVGRRSAGGDQRRIKSAL